MDLVDFVHHYENKIEEMRLAELEEDFHCKNGMPHLRVKSGIFKHAASSLSDLGTKIVKQKLMEAMKILENDEETANVMGNLNKKDNQINNNVSSNECPVLNPPIIRAKGVTNARIKNSLEKRKKKSAKVGSSSQSSRPNTMSFGNFILLLALMI
ncbi:hypothetical protein FEM48_Zijuj04G0060300 [Ziziphus jujuba var. spinosa]|uniref:Uncharacterized protein n=1 Tax=Ziziphus jujuba var. spinosa TaxID=714518 RepID=A0A978VI79_ZIZJJ|nr:hypothetical protein FEM48_Zijuj04G0060300 [Ziziphus jujuba var. spinosa]